MTRRICVTGKQIFPNQLEADLAIADVHRSNSHHRHRKYREEPQRSYKCNHCTGWHFTSSPLETENRESVSS